MYPPPDQVRFRTESVNSSEIANGILSALVSITAGCPFVDYWGACLIGGQWSLVWLARREELCHSNLTTVSVALFLLQLFSMAAS